MRLKADIWVKSYLRRCAGEGAAAAVVRHGDDDAGAIFIRINRLDGTSVLYGPAPAGLPGTEGDRRWVAVLRSTVAADAEVEAYLEREARIDSDLWIVEVEDRDGCHRLEGWLLEQRD